MARGKNSEFDPRRKVGQSSYIEALNLRMQSVEDSQWLPKKSDEEQIYGPDDKGGSAGALVGAKPKPSGGGGTAYALWAQSLPGAKRG